MNYGERREEFVVKMGGALKIHPAGELVKYEYNEVTDEVELVEGGHPGLLPLCICGQTSYTLHKITVDGKETIHYLGTCCINKYGKTGVFGGKRGIKQRSWEQLGVSLKHLRLNMKLSDTVTIDKVINRIGRGCGWYMMNEKVEIENLIGYTLRFVPGCKEWESCTVPSYPLNTKTPEEMAERRLRSGYEQRHLKITFEEYKEGMRDGRYG